MSTRYLMLPLLEVVDLPVEAGAEHEIAVRYADDQAALVLPAHLLVTYLHVSVPSKPTEPSRETVAEARARVLAGLGPKRSAINDQNVREGRADPTAAGLAGVQTTDEVFRVNSGRDGNNPTDAQLQMWCRDVQDRALAPMVRRASAGRLERLPSTVLMRAKPYLTQETRQQLAAAIAITQADSPNIVNAPGYLSAFVADDPDDMPVGGGHPASWDGLPSIRVAEVTQPEAVQRLNRALSEAADDDNPFGQSTYGPSNAEANFSRGVGSGKMAVSARGPTDR